jgi:hypothetical protein
MDPPELYSCHLLLFHAAYTRPFVRESRKASCLGDTQDCSDSAIPYDADAAYHDLQGVFIHL